MKLCRVPVRLLPTAARELDEFIRLWKREVLLDRRALLLDCHDMDESTRSREAAVLRLVTELPGVIFLAGHERRDTATRLSAIFEVLPECKLVPDATTYTAFFFEICFSLFFLLG